MSTYIITIVGTETKAYEAVSAFKQLHDEGSITLYDSSVVQLGPDGLLRVKEGSTGLERGTGLGALLGMLVGVFGGPVGVAVGAAAGGAIGGGSAFYRGEVSEEFLEDVTKQMQPGDFAVLAEIAEPWTAPVDTRMHALGGKVVREQRRDFEAQLMEQRARTHQAEVEQRKAERASRKAGRLESKLEDSIVEARERLLRVAAKAHDKLEVTQRELQDKLAALEDQAVKATPETKQEIEQRITELRADFTARAGKLTQAYDVAQQALQA